MWRKIVVGITVAYAIIALYLIVNNSLSLAWLLPGLLFFIGLFSWGVFDIRLGFFIPVVFKSPNPQPRTVALTFDDGPTPYTLEVLDLLQQYQAKATFFCIGQQLEQYPDIAKRILADGHTIGNHSYSHPNSMGFLSTAQVKEEIQKCDQIIEQLLQIKSPFYRPPFGITNPHIAKALRQTKHRVIGWNNRSLDTVIQDENTIFKRIYKRIDRQPIVLLHDTSNRSVQVLATLLKQLQQDNYKLVNLVEFLNEEKQ
ncbi:polysaccharide deacetylase family protein [Myroides sp. 1354]|uniref:polysaccharide deacetylase family protein n=1 Tax=unclassified Myroides TaxID=2642485 RepID=UPI002578E7AA|nr:MULTISPECIES: polysaccharide deacetylase family protein [unclassified Myroides]MDM1043676.1 polysaccharide deacetylase family protein [Myroides sp. R163-1]MDM1054274.1 polysaccharide deacetylase family protein [Myroides sp. 1354]MDM1067570.1 polysaccharide deacetylase family protein [Myroides sp. 1372]